MTHAPAGFSRFVLASLALMCAGAVGCSEDAVAPRAPVPPIDHMANLGTYIVHVDVAHQTVDVHPVGQNMDTPPGVDARFYGLSTEIQHVFTFFSTTPIGTDGAEYHLREHINNLKTFAIGTNSPHTAPAFPQDTMGVYVYLSIPPFHFTCSTGCGDTSAVMDSADGTYPFFDNHGLSQPYLYFKTILEPGTFNVLSGSRGYTDQTSLGGIDYFRTFNFRTTGFVSDFSFGISVSAAWVDPNETRWKVFYVADSLPNRGVFPNLRSEPDWRVLGAGGVATIVSNKLQLVSSPADATSKDTLIYFRSDSVRSTQDAYIDATMTATNLTTGVLPAVFLGLEDQNKLVQLGISGTLTGFTDGAGAFVGTPVATDPARTSWRVSKIGSSTAAIYSPSGAATPLVTIPYASLPTVTAKPPGGYDRFFFFGNITQPTGPTATSTWTTVNYEVGAAAP